jgi:protein N-lysine methyltransferase METTL21D
MILEQAHLRSEFSLLNQAKLSSLNVLELGCATLISLLALTACSRCFSAGIGLLAVALSSLFKSYTVTDIPALVPLIKKNLALNSSIASPAASAEELDWLTLQSTPTNRRPFLFARPDPLDLVLVVDCIYHPSLLPSLVETIDYLAAPVLVVVELRSHEVIQEFLELWLAKPGWKIWRIGREHTLPRPYAVWFGTRI